MVLPRKVVSLNEVECESGDDLNSKFGNDQNIKEIIYYNNEFLHLIGSGC